MQHLPGDVLQEPQQPREGEAERGDAKHRATPEEGGGVDPRPCAASPRTLPLAPSDSPCARASQAAFFGEAVQALRRQATELQEAPSLSRRPRAATDTAQPPQRHQQTCLRSGLGPGASPPSSRAPAPAPVPSQLLGRRVGSDADLLRSLRSSLPCSSTSDYHCARKASTVEHLRALLSPTWTGVAGTGLPTHHPSETSAKEHDTPPKTPASTSSSDTPNTTSSSSSFASSFAYLLRDNRSDKRLLKRKSKPSQHLTRQPSRPSVEMKRSPSYYKPRVVEDSAIKGQPTRTTPLLSAPSFIAATSNYTAEPNDPKPPSTPSTKRSMSPIRPLQMLSQSQPSTKSDFPSALKRAMTMPKRPALAKLSPALPTVTTSSPSLKTSGALQVRFKTPSIPAAHSMSSALRHNLEDKTRPSKKTHKQDGASMKAHYHDMTPPESEPGIPGHILFHHGDRYFKTFVDEPVPVKESAGASTRDRSNRSTPSTSPGGAYSRLGPARESPTKIPSDPPWSSPVSKRERSSIFKSFRKSAATDSVVEAPNSGIVGTALPHGEAPGILISGP